MHVIHMIYIVLSFLSSNFHFELQGKYNIFCEYDMEGSFDEFTTKNVFGKTKFGKCIPYSDQKL